MTSASAIEGRANIPRETEQHRRLLSSRRPWHSFIFSLLTMTFSLASIATIMLGWTWRHENWLSPEVGLGYWLGIAGSTAMVLLLVYPLRKRVVGLRAIGSVALWFRIHMMLGVIGPIFILYHANFGLGSTNANVALVSMLLVASSGLVGRYLYGKVHRGADGRIEAIDELLGHIKGSPAKYPLRPGVADHLVADLKAIADQALSRDGAGAVVALRNLLLFRVRWWRLRRQIAKSLPLKIAQSNSVQSLSRKQKIAELREADRVLDIFAGCLREAQMARIFVRVFAAWHVLHLPLFLLLLIAATLHVVAVHIY
jgi:hypothetical protein